MDEDGARVACAAWILRIPFACDPFSCFSDMLPILFDVGDESSATQPNDRGSNE